MKRFLPLALLAVLAAAAWWATRAGGEAPAPPREQPARRATVDQPGPQPEPAAEPPPADGGERARALALNQEALGSLSAGDAAAAEPLFARAAELAPDEPVFRVNLSRARVRLGRDAWEAGRSAEAMAWFERAAEADGDGGGPAEWSASILLREGDRAGAERAIAAALLAYPASAGLLRLRSELAFLRGDLAAAVADARAALALQEAPGARARLAQLEEEARVTRDYLTDATAHFDSRYDPNDRALVARLPALHAELEQAWQEVVARVGVQPAQRLLVMWLSPERWSGAAPKWSAGLYDGRVRLLVREGAGAESALRATMRHELTHALLHALGARLPTWLHEGLAQRAEGGDPERARAWLRSHPRRLGADSLDGDWTAWTDAALADEAYATALSLVEWIEGQAGANAWTSLLLAAPERGFEEAWAAVFARPFAEWEREHAEWLAREGG